MDVTSQPQAEEVLCPHCGQVVLVPAEPSPAEKERGDLDGLRIRQVYQLRRSLYRTRRYWLVGTGVCVVAAGQIMWHVFTSPTGVLGMSKARATVLAVLFLIVGVVFFMKSRRLTEAAGRSALGEPELSPDLSSLSDGSQHWKNLEAMGRNHPDDNAS
jgi:hypothetical protein